MKTVNLYLSSMEAQYGCQKTLSLPGQVTPLRISLKPGIRNRQRIMIKNAQFYDGYGNVSTILICVRIFVNSSGKVKNQGKSSKAGKVMRTVAAVAVLLSTIYLFAPKKSPSTVSGSNAAQGNGIGPNIQAEEPAYGPPADNGRQGNSSSVKAGGTQENEVNAAFDATSDAPGAGYTSIPTVLIQQNWQNRFDSPEYLPRFVFYEDGRCDMWINLGYTYYKETLTYQVYEYDTGPRTIVCDTSVVHLDERLASEIYLVESEGGCWSYYGDAIGFTGITESFSKADESTISVPRKYVKAAEFSKYGHSWGSLGGDELTIDWIDGGLVYLNFSIYRMFGYDNQVAVSVPGKTAYCFLNNDEDYDWAADGCIKLTFLDHGVSLQVLSASENSGYLRDYVGQTIAFNIDQGVLLPMPARQ